MERPNTTGLSLTDFYIRYMGDLLKKSLVTFLGKSQQDKHALAADIERRLSRFW
jgi:hypothetical protein